MLKEKKLKKMNKKQKKMKNSPFPRIRFQEKTFLKKSLYFFFKNKPKIRLLSGYITVYSIYSTYIIFNIYYKI